MSTEFSTKFVYALNYSSFDFGAFVHPFLDRNQDTSVSLSSDEFSHQSLFIGTIGKSFFGCLQTVFLGFFKIVMLLIQNT